MANKAKAKKQNNSKPTNSSKTAAQNDKTREKAKRPSNKTASAQPAAAAVPKTRPVAIVGVGASAGGLEAFEQLLQAVRPDTGMAFVLVQHLAPKHESILSELLRKSTDMSVLEVREGMAVEANHVYVIPPNADMTIQNGVLHLSPLAERAHRMPIDSFFQSLGEDQFGRAIGIILSGTASDGTLGLQSIKASGGITFAQDERSAKYSAMPQNAVAAGNVDYVLPPHLIARELTHISKHMHAVMADDGAAASSLGPVDETLNAIFSILRNYSRVDFSFYKHATIKRRITRRMFLRKIDSLDNYVQYLRKNREEVAALFDDVLINVTGFFRDPDAFDALSKHAFPQITKNKSPNAPIRLWIPGCSTGEEAYSLAIVLLEYMGEQSKNYQIQIFATDVNENIIQKARAGIYPENIAVEVAPERLRRFFQKVDGGYQISKTIRDMCIFAKQDVAKDPPFSKLDMISCRNVMIYMGQVLQKRIIPVFHYALNPEGILFLGSSETVGGFGDLFTPLEKKYKIFSKASVLGPITFDFVPHYEFEEKIKGESAKPKPNLDLQRLAEQLLLNHYCPAAVLVGEDLDIVQFIGQMGRFIDPSPGNASLNLLRMAKSGLDLELQLAFQHIKQNGTIRKEGVHIPHNGELKSVGFEIIPVKSIPGKEHYLVAFFEEAPKPVGKENPAKNTKQKQKLEKSASLGIEKENARLKEELEATREYLQSIIEEQRSTNEELRSANEEIQSSNEELQSINEELETAKEELQSTNEELTTVNEELQNRNDELTQLNNDLNNLLGSVNIPIVMLGSDLRIRRFTPMSEKVMNLIPTDVGRPISDIKPNIKIPEFRQVISNVIDTLEIYEKDVEDPTGKMYSLRIRPYRTIDNKIDGVTIVLLDLDSRRSRKT